MFFKLGRFLQATYFGILTASSSSLAQETPRKIELPTLSEEARISLLTVAPGQAIHSIFGHCALRVRDPKLGIDAVYSYPAIITSKSRFFLESGTENRSGIYSRSTFDKYIQHHTLIGQEVRESVLNLEQKQKQAFSDRLLNNYLHEERIYPYHPFAKNCATLPFDLILSLIGSDLIFEKDLDDKTGQSYFERIQPYFPPHPWTAIGMNLSLGIGTQRNLTYREQAFLPQLIEESLQETFIQTPDGEEPLVAEQSILIEGKPDTTYAFIPKPIWLLSATLILTIYVTFKEMASGKYALTFDRLLFGTVSLQGAVLVYTSMHIAHDYSIYNFNLIWASPLHIFALFLPSKLKRGTRVYFRIYSLVFTLVAAVFFFAIPALSTQLWPLLLALLIRATQIPRHSASNVS